MLGASRIPTDNGVGWWYQLGSLKLSLLPNAEEPSPAEFPTHAMPMLWLEVQDLTAALEWLTAAEVNVVDHDDGLFVMVTDPDGLLIEIWQA